MSDEVDGAEAAQGEQARLRALMRWFVCASGAVLVALIAWSIVAAANGSGAGMVAASSGSVAVVLASTTGYLAMKKRLDQLVTPRADP